MVQLPQRAWVRMKAIEPSAAIVPTNVAWLLQGASRSTFPENCAPFCVGTEVMAVHVCVVAIPSAAIHRSRDAPTVPPPYEP
jgi:hypothetical protein